MIDVVAVIRVKEGKVEELLQKLKDNIPAVLGEDGCVAYYPTVDADAGVPAQDLNPNEVTVLEKWESIEALHAHLQAPHMVAYRKRVADLVESVRLRVLTAA